MTRKKDSSGDKNNKPMEQLADNTLDASKSLDELKKVADELAKELRDLKKASKSPAQQKIFDKQEELNSKRKLILEAKAAEKQRELSKKAEKKQRELNEKAEKDYYKEIEKEQEAKLHKEIEERKKATEKEARNNKYAIDQWNKYLAKEKVEKEKESKRQEAIEELNLHREQASWAKNKEATKKAAEKEAKDNKYAIDQWNKYLAKEKVEKEKEIKRQEAIEESTLHEEIEEWKKAKDKEFKEYEGLTKNIYRGFAQVANPIIQDFLSLKAYEGIQSLNKATGNNPQIKNVLSMLMPFVPAFAQGLMTVAGFAFGKFFSDMSTNILMSIGGSIKGLFNKSIAEPLVDKVSKIPGVGGMGAGNAVAGLAALGMGASAIDRANKKDYAGAGIAGVGATGFGVAALAPILAGIAGALGIAFSPLIAPIAVAIGVIAGIVLLLKDHWGWFRKKFMQFTKWTGDIFNGIWSWLKKTVLTPKNFIDAVLMAFPFMGMLKAVGDWINKKMGGDPDVSNGSQQGKSKGAGIGGWIGHNVFHNQKAGEEIGGDIGASLGAIKGVGVAGIHSMGQYIKGAGNWSSKRGSTQAGTMSSFASKGLMYDPSEFRRGKNGGYLTDAPEANAGFVNRLSQARSAMKRIYGKNADFILTGGHAVHAGVHAGNSRHNYGSAVDIGRVKGVSPQQATAVLAAYGITRPNAQGDPLHFEYTGGGAKLTAPSMIAKTPKKDTNNIHNHNNDSRSNSTMNQQLAQGNPAASGQPSNRHGSPRTNIVVPSGNDDPTGSKELLRTLNHGTNLITL